MKRFRVRVAEDAEQDLVDVYRYVATHDTAEKAAYVLEQLETLCARLANLPLRGHIPPELDRIGRSTNRAHSVSNCSSTYAAFSAES